MLWNWKAIEIIKNISEYLKLFQQLFGFDQTIKILELYII